MSTQTLLESDSALSLLRLLVSNRAIRHRAIRAIEKRSYRALVEENPDNRPRRVQEDKHDYLMALLSSFDRAIEKGLISKHVLQRLLQVLAANVILSTDWERAAESLGFVPPMFVLVSPTGNCNLRCAGCYAASQPGNYASLDFKTFDRILTEKRELWGANTTCWTWWPGTHRTPGWSTPTPR